MLVTSCCLVKFSLSDNVDTGATCDMCPWMHVTFYWRDHDYVAMIWSIMLEPILTHLKGVTAKACILIGK